jgi:hypothetical protein
VADNDEPPARDDVGTDQAHAEAARELERDNPDWIVVFGVYSQQFVAFPRFPAPPRTIVVASYPGALPTRMRAVERRLHVARRQRRNGPQVDG